MQVVQTTDTAHADAKALQGKLSHHLSPDLLILDDLGLYRLTAQQSADLYELIIGRHRASSVVVISNRAVEEWLSLFGDPTLGNSVLDRLANASFQIVAEGGQLQREISAPPQTVGRPGR